MNEERFILKPGDFEFVDDEPVAEARSPIIEVTDRPLSPLYESYLVRSIERMRLMEANPSVDDAIRALRTERRLRLRIRAIRDVLSLEQTLREVENRVMQQTAEMLEQSRLYVLERLQQARGSWDIHQAQMILIELERQQAIIDDAIYSALRDALDEALFGGQRQAVQPLLRAGIEISIEPMISRQFVLVSQATLPRLITDVSNQMIGRIGTLLRQSVLGQHSIFELMQEIGKVPGMTTVSDYLKPFRWSPKDVRRATRGQGPYAKAFYRAEMITRTEIGRIAQTANYLTLAELARTDAGYMKEWGAVDDARTRPWHAAADGQRVAVNEPFSIGGEAMMYPHDPRASGRNTINCRCVSIPWHPRFDDPDLGDE